MTKKQGCCEKFHKNGCLSYQNSCDIIQMFVQQELKNNNVPIPKEIQQIVLNETKKIIRKKLPNSCLSANLFRLGIKFDKELPKIIAKRISEETK